MSIINYGDPEPPRNIDWYDATGENWVWNWEEEMWSCGWKSHHWRDMRDAYFPGEVA